MIHWTERALRQLDQVHDYIKLSHREAVGDRVLLEIAASIERLAIFPMLGRKGRVPGTREFVIPRTPFVAAYAMENENVFILAIYHGARQWPEKF